jgi:phosphoribosylglycinamide formyltransferase 1
MAWMPEAPASTRERTRAAVLISGRGSNLNALIERCARPNGTARIDLVIANRPDAAGLDLARAAGIATAVLDRRAHGSRAGFEQAIDARLKEARIQIVCLAGFMLVLSEWLVERWRDRLLNIHPSLLPAFRGLDTHRRALDAGVRFTGCTVHFVRAEVDAGPIVVQGVVPVLAGDDEASLAARVLRAEHRCYPLALDLVASGRARIDGERVILDGAQAPEPGMLMNPIE